MGNWQKYQKDNIEDFINEDGARVGRTFGAVGFGLGAEDCQPIAGLEGALEFTEPWTRSLKPTAPLGGMRNQPDLLSLGQHALINVAQIQQCMAFLDRCAHDYLARERKAH